VKFYDLVENEIEVGDIVAAAMTVGQSAELRVGTVLELIDKSQKVRVDWKVGFRSYRSRNQTATLVQGNDKLIQQGMRKHIDNRSYPHYVPTGDTKVSKLLVLDRIDIDKYKD
jgi:hypothetical protein